MLHITTGGGSNGGETRTKPYECAY